MTFAFPIALLLLLLLPLIWYIGRPRYAFRRRRDIASLVLRTVIVVLVVLALAGLQVVQAVDKLAVVFLVDASDSMGAAAREAQFDYIREAVARKSGDDEWAIVVFGENVSIDKPFSAVTDVAPIRSTVLAGNTNIAEAIQTAISLFPANTVRRIVLLSDGRETIGNAVARAQFAAASGVEISYVPFFRAPVPDVRVTSLDAPVRVVAGQEFDINVTIQAEAATPATLLIFSGGSLISETNVQLQAGTTGYTLTRTARESGFLNFSARVVVPGDGINQNNELAAFSQVIGPPRILLVASDLADITNLRPALESAGLAVDVRTPANLLPETAALANYKAIIIVNVPATDLSNRQMERLQSYVRDLGGGLVFVGGLHSYGPGGYYLTPIEETLPVEMQIKDQQRLPQLTIAYLVDRSGSMATTDASGIPYLELAKRAIELSIDFLQPTDRAGVGSFDTGGAWVVPVQNVENKRQLQLQVGTLRPGGGTDIMAGMRLVEKDIISEPSQRKHIILLTDGGASSTGLVQLTRQLNQQYGVTTSVIALGEKPPEFLRQMSEAGGGNYHHVVDFSQLPNIYAIETALASRSYVTEGEFMPVLTSNSPIMTGITALPPLHGYIVTTSKTTAQTVLRGPEPFSDPLLAQWQYGLGRAVAFTSDATAHWATNWITWEGFVRFWAQVVGWTMTESAENNIETRITLTDGRARIVVDARDAAGAFLNNLTLEATVLDPDNQARTVTLQQIAPGRYEGIFTPSGEGAYFVAIDGQGMMNNAPVTFREVNGWVMSYSAEYLQSGTDERLLATLATTTGGQSLANNPQAVFAHTAEFRTAAAPAAPWLLLLAVLLLLPDIAVRRLIISRSDLQRLWLYFMGEDTGSILQAERLSALKDVRARAREKTGSGAEETIHLLKQRHKTISEARDMPAPRPVTTEPKPPEEVVYTPSEELPRPVSGDESTVGSLLKRRKRDENDNSGP